MAGTKGADHTTGTLVRPSATNASASSAYSEAQVLLPSRSAEAASGGPGQA
jgi:hypothetical protein